MPATPRASGRHRVRVEAGTPVADLEANAVADSGQLDLDRPTRRRDARRSTGPPGARDRDPIFVTTVGASPGSPASDAARRPARSVARARGRRASTTSATDIESNAGDRRPDAISRRSPSALETASETTSPPSSSSSRSRASDRVWAGPSWRSLPIRRSPASFRAVVRSAARRSRPWSACVLVEQSGQLRRPGRGGRPAGARSCRCPASRCRRAGGTRQQRRQRHDGPRGRPRGRRLRHRSRRGAGRTR